ncbi:MAG: OB-fold nucleic acid binding domain-containing protein [Nitrososphaerota archaeon]|nr:OB-fold nucleic acid binding domain-containing protein [Candidatus Bathyarchaeota archaeon]MDW8023188.1 OB-fold nucleic acid binding domain-containing protein [Nitrososphaerota archaeon]
MAAVEEIIRKILSKNPELSREEIMKMLESEKRKTGGYISDEILLQMIAARLGVEVSGEAAKPKLLIGNLVPGLNDVTIVGRVIAVFSAKPSKNSKGVKVTSVLVADKSGILRVVLWNDKAAFVESGRLKAGQLVRFHHGYTREDFGGKVELHVGEKGEVEVSPQDVEPEEYPTIEGFSTKIGEVTSAYKNKRIHILGKVEDFFPPSTFKRQDLRIGKVMRFILTDETGKIPVVVWNDKVDEIERFIKKGERLHIVNAKVKKAANGGLEAHADSRTYIGFLKPADRLLKINHLKEGLRNVNVQGRVVVKPSLREVKTSRGEPVKLAVFEIEDETGKIWVSAWRKNAEKVVNLKVGDKIVVKNAHVKKGFGDQLEISAGNATSIETLHEAWGL